MAIRRVFVPKVEQDKQKVRSDRFYPVPDWQENA